MNYEIIIEALEHFYEEEVFMEYDRNKGGIWYSFKMLRKCIETQQSIIEIKKEANIDFAENEEKLEKLKKYWMDDVGDPLEVIEKLKEELEYDLEWIPREIKNSQERGWGIEYEDDLRKRYNNSKEKLEKVKLYTEKDLEKVIGVKPF